MPIPALVAPLVLGAMGGAFVWNKVDDAVIDPASDAYNTARNLTAVGQDMTKKVAVYGAVAFGAYLILKKQGLLK